MHNHIHTQTLTHTHTHAPTDRASARCVCLYRQSSQRTGRVSSALVWVRAIVCVIMCERMWLCVCWCSVQISVANKYTLTHALSPPPIHPSCPRDHFPFLVYLYRFCCLISRRCRFGDSTPSNFLSADICSNSWGQTVRQRSEKQS